MDKNSIKQLAIIAPTASGKTELSLNLASKLDGVILSLDSLSVYKYIDIASAKPTKEERGDIIHFGIDKVEPSESFDVIEFITEYQNAVEYCKNNNKALIIVGGTSFYLKSMLTGLSKTIQLNSEQTKELEEKLSDINSSYEQLLKLDPLYMGKIASSDKYRIQKALEIYITSGLTPSKYFEINTQEPIIEEIPIFQINTEKEILRERISKRTKIMIENGLIDEVIFLEKKYSREPNCMSSIGIKETLDYLDGRFDKKELEELISIHTAQLAKRQRTFNKSQFSNIVTANLKDLEKSILNMI